MSYATILIPGSGIIAAYGTNQQEFANAIGIYLTTWCIVTFLFAYVLPSFFLLPITTDDLFS
jgi:uncharacterized protein